MLKRWQSWYRSIVQSIRDPSRSRFWCWDCECYVEAMTELIQEHSAQYQRSLKEQILVLRLWVLCWSYDGADTGAECRVSEVSQGADLGAYWAAEAACGAERAASTRTAVTAAAPTTHAIDQWCWWELNALVHSVKNRAMVTQPSQIDPLEPVRCAASCTWCCT